MALSDHEQQLLDQLERQLRADDPHFADSIGSSSIADPTRPRLSVKHIILGVLAVVVGIGVVILGVALKQILIGVLGFLIAAAGLYWVTSRASSSQSNNAVPGRARNSHQSTAKSSKFMQNLEERWDNRQRGGF